MLNEDLITPEIDNLLRAVKGAESDTFSVLSKIAGLDPAIDFKFINLDDVDFNGSDLRNFNFSYTSLRNTNWAGAVYDNSTILTGAELAGSNIQRDALFHLSQLPTIGGLAERQKHYQTTVKDDVILAGIGIHSGKPSSIKIRPSAPNTGFIFRKANEDRSEIRALVTEIASTDLTIVLGDLAANYVVGPEHLMAVLRGMGIDNALIEIEGTEVPAMDGSGIEFVHAIEKVGLMVSEISRRYVVIERPFRVETGASWIEGLPLNHFRIDVEIDFESPAIGRQTYRFDAEDDDFRSQIAPARTFGFLKDIERLWAADYALGSSLENTVVIAEDNRTINIEGLRYPDEFVRHKTLDTIGVLAHSGAAILGEFRTYRPSHKLTALWLKKFLSDRRNFSVFEVSSSPDKKMHAIHSNL